MRGRIAVALAIGLGSTGCSGSSKTPLPGVVRGEIRYSGALGGGARPLAIAVYSSFPPSGPPITFELVENYTFPHRYEFGGFAPGRYWVGASIDVDRMDTRWAGMLNPRRDPFGYAARGGPIELSDAQGVAGADIELEDPR